MYVKKSNNPIYSLFLPITRKWFFDTFIRSIHDIDLPKNRVEVIFYLDTNDKELEQMVLLQAKIMALNGFNGVGIFTSGKDQPGEYGQRDERRKRIIEMREKTKEIIKGQYIFSVEDDTIVPRYAFKKLSKIIETGSNVGFVTGAEVGRWGIECVGAYQFTEEKGKLVAFKSLMPSEGVQSIDAGGMYCYIARTDLYKKIKFRNESELGPDMLFVLDIKKTHNAFIDWSVKCEHHTKGRVYTLDDALELQGEFKDKWHLTYESQGGKIKLS